MRLSLCIPTYNEEKNIRLPIESAIDLADEVVIVDGGSADDTIKIASSYGPKIKIYKVDNPANFLKNKQRAIEYAKGDWILQLDADEAVSDELKTELKSMIHRNFQFPISNYQTNSKYQDADITGYYIPRKNWFLGRYLMKGGVYPDPILRLYKREGSHFKLENIHENVVVDGKTEWLNGAILHHADPTFERYIQRWNKYTSFDAEQLVKKGVKLCFPCYFLGKPLFTFLNIYIRHKGFMDGFPGFVWALFSAIRYWAIYVKARRLES